VVRWVRFVAAALGLLVAATLIGPASGSTGNAGWLHTDGATIRTAEGRPHVIKAVAWFGMETPNCAPHGLWQIGLEDGLAAIRSFGFNTVRLPFSNACLHAAATTGIDAAANPGLVDLTPLQLMDRFVASARRHGLQVLLDRHRPTSSSQSPLWYTDAVSEADWIADWTMLARRYADDPTVVGVDLHNEPHGEACWGCGDVRRDWAAAATRAGDAVLAENPRLLIVVEGVEKQGNGAATWWGGGLADVEDHPIRLRVADRVVYSPHDYPSSLFPQSWFSAPDYPANLPAHWDRTWGYLAKKDIAPVLLGEFGTRLETASDRQWLSTLVSYLGETRMSFAYWSFNPNSGDTGGLVADDWTTPQRAKLEALRPILGTAAPLPPAPAPSTTPPPSAGPTADPTPSSAPPASGSPAGDLTADWQLRSGWNGGYVAEVVVTSAVDRSGWSLSYADPAARSVVNSWGMTCRLADGRITCTGSDWGTGLPARTGRVVGLQVATSGDAPTDPALELR
jgi:endoglucanase